MRVESITAVGFGPFAGEMLDLAPGMNVVYGQNESGKSSWHAALYAALCGMKRVRGRANREDQDFSNRHRPWNGGAWSVSAVIELDDGRSIDLEQRFGRGGRSSAIDRVTRLPLTADLEREGAIDVGSLLGLTRETAVSTIFVRQADVLRVLAEASALQEYLERAATTSSVDTTADEALARITAFKRDRVGLLRVGSRGPLATATRVRDEARSALDEAENGYENYQDLLARRRDLEANVADAERALDVLRLHETERARLEQWDDIRGAERTLDQARLLQDQIAAGPTSDGTLKEAVSLVTRAVVAFETRPSVPVALDGQGIDELEAELAALPAMPEGDVEPAAQVTAVREAWQREVQRLAAHEANVPEPTGAGEPPEQEGATAAEIEAELAALPAMPEGDVEPAAQVTTAREAWQRENQRLRSHEDTEPPKLETNGLPIPASEVRRLADELETSMPIVDPSLREDVQRRRTLMKDPVLDPVPALATPLAPGAASPLPRVLVVCGVVLFVVGALALVLGQPIVGGLAAVLGAALGGAGYLLSSRSATAPNHPVPPASSSAPDVELQRLEARLLLEEEAVAQAARRRDSAVSILEQWDLPFDPTELRRLASAHDARDGDRERRLQWEDRRVELESAVESTVRELREALVARGIKTGDHDDLDVAYQQYVEECRERARHTAQSARRGDLEARLKERQAADAARKSGGDRAMEWERRRVELEKGVSVAAHELHRVLAGRGIDVNGDDLDPGYERYVRECRDRAKQAGRAARRSDLEARLAERRAADAARDAEGERAKDWERRRIELEHGVGIAAHELQDVLQRHGIETDDDDLDVAYQRYRECCRTRARQAAQAGRRPDLEARLVERRAAEAARDNELAARATAEHQLYAAAEMAAITRADDPDEVAAMLREWIDAQERLEVEQQAIAETVARLDQLLDGGTLEDLAVDVQTRIALAGDRPADDIVSLDDWTEEMAAQEKRVRSARDQLAELVGQLGVEGGHLVDVSVALEAEARADAEVRRLTALAEDVDRAAELLGVAQRKVHADIAPVLNATLRPWVPRITLGRYDDIRVSPATLELEAHEAGGSFRPATLLSQGTTEQLFLLLRLALAQHLATTGESAPVILDDVTVQSDSNRTVGILDLLHELSSDRQVVLFSQEEEVLAWAESHLAESRDRVIRLPARS